MNTVWIIFGIAVITLSVYSMISVVISNMDNNRKILWFVIVSLFPVIGPITYYSVRPHKP